MKDLTALNNLRHFVSYVGFGADFPKKKEVEVNENFNPLPLPEGFIGFYTYDKFGNEICNKSHVTFFWFEDKVVTIGCAKRMPLFADKFGKLLKYDNEVYIIFNDNGGFIVLNEADTVLSPKEP